LRRSASRSPDPLRIRPSTEPDRPGLPMDQPDPPAEGPKLHSVKPPKRSYITREIYDRMTEVYVKGARSAGEIMKATGVIRKTARKAIERGWPEHGWAPLKERAAFYDKMHEQASNAEDPKRAKEARDFLAMREEYLNITHAARAAFAQGLRVILPAIPGAAIVKTEARRQLHYEEVLDAKGAVVRRIPRTITVDVVVPLSIVELMHAAHLAASGVKGIGMGELEQLMAKPPTAERKKHSLTWDQIEWMAANGGRVPPGVTADQLGDL
jgi:hypothetical protein